MVRCVPVFRGLGNNEITYRSKASFPFSGLFAEPFGLLEKLSAVLSLDGVLRVRPLIANTHEEDSWR
jgi:hypothetical protein